MRISNKADIRHLKFDTSDKDLKSSEMLHEVTQ